MRDESVLVALLQTPGLSSMELSKAHDLDRLRCARRLSDLATLGLVQRGLKRECKITGHRVLTWFPAGDFEIKA